MEYHYGKTIREYRMLRDLTLTQLAEKWPSKDQGVTVRYVSDIERGVKHVGDPLILRDLASMLQIPLWKFGLSEYNPFQDIEQSIIQSSRKPDMFLLDAFIQQLWTIRMLNGIAIDNHVSYINTLLDETMREYPTLSKDNNFMHMYAQATRLSAIKAYEQKDYTNAVSLFCKMIDIAEISSNRDDMVIAYMGAGVELMRQEEYKESEKYLQKAKDVSFDASKDLASLVYGRLTRYYASIGDIYNFEKNYNFAINFGRIVHDSLNKSVYVLDSISQTMEELSNGYILLNDGRKALEVLPDIEKQIEQEKNKPLAMWIPLDYAQAFLCLDEIEESIKWLKVFREKIAPIATIHIMSKVTGHIREIETKGYGTMPVVREFKEMLRESK